MIESFLGSTFEFSVFFKHKRKASIGGVLGDAAGCIKAFKEIARELMEWASPHDCFLARESFRCGLDG